MSAGALRQLIRTLMAERDEARQVAQVLANTGTWNPQQPFRVEQWERAVEVALTYPEAAIEYPEVPHG
jgi:hypothetical protein